MTIHALIVAGGNGLQAAGLQEARVGRMLVHRLFTFHAVQFGRQPFAAAFAAA